MKKSILIKGLLAFLAAAVFLTYLAFQIERNNTPKVRVGAPTSGNLAYTASFTALLAYDEITEYTAPTELLVTKVMAKPGDSLFKGTTLLQIAPDSVQAALHEAEKNVEARRRAYEALPEESVERVSAGWELAKAEKIRDQLRQIEEDGNAVRLDCEGDLLELPIKEPGIHPAGTLLAKWSDNTAGATLTWQAGDGFYLPGDIVKTRLSYDKGTKDVEVQITGRRYLAERGVFEYEAAVPAEEDARLTMGAYEKVAVQALRTSTQYRALLPASALIWQTNSSASVYTVVTDNQTRKPTAKRIDVSVQATDGTWAVVDKAMNDPVVFYSDRPLTDGEQVIVEEE